MEQRLIDADALKETIMDMRNHCEPEPCLPYQTFLIPDTLIKRKIEEQHAIDAVPVVRCRKCKHRKTPTDYCEKLKKSYVPDDFYCKFGERKDGADGERRSE